jgi:AbrB family looped-hinge helix DNA binding protein
MTTTVTQKGQVTIPKSVRDRMGIAPGSRVGFVLLADGHVALVKEDGGATLRPSGDAGDWIARSGFADVIGCASTRMRTDEIMALLRDPV